MNYDLLAPIQYDNIITQILTTRGLNEDDIEHYLHTSSADVYSPKILMNITLATQILIKHIYNDDKVYLIIDPDCDGFTSSALLLNYLNNLFPHTIQTNFSYGFHKDKTHGLTDMDIPDGTKLVICADSSSNDYELHELFYNNGIDVIVLDHHEADKISEYACVVNNQLCDYPTKSLSGVGIVYKFCCYIDELMKTNYAENYLDLVALGLIADMMETKDFETQYFIQTGLTQVQNPYFKEMCSRDSKHFGNGTIYMNDVAWYVAPYVNAVTREGTQTEKLLLFEAMLDYKAYEMIPSTKRGCKGQLETRSEQAGRTSINVKKRQDDTTNSVIEDIEDLIIQQNLLANKILIIRITNKSITKNFNGLVANKLAGKYQKPCLVLQQVIDDNGLVHWVGSARGYDKSGLKDFKKYLLSTNLIDWAEGHKNACGVSIPETNINEFIKKSNDELTMIDGNVKYDVDYIWNTNELNSTNILTIADYKELWGYGMPEPIIAIENVRIASDTLHFIGNTGKTMRIDLPNKINAIKFFITDEEKEALQVNDETWFANLIVKCDKNEWMGNISAQFQLVDYEIIRKQKYYF